MVKGMQSLSRKTCKVLVLQYLWPNLKWERRLEDKFSAHKMARQNESVKVIGEVGTPQKAQGDREEQEADGVTAWPFGEGFPGCQRREKGPT